jgi:hypothetical protein
LSLREVLENCDLDLRNPHNFAPPPSRNDHSPRCCNGVTRVRFKLVPASVQRFARTTRVPYSSWTVLLMLFSL